MKASLTLREDPKPPIIKAKIPLTIFGLPFSTASVAAGDRDELCISFNGGLGWTGTGILGSVTAEFSSVGGGSPEFLLHFKSRSGDFYVRRSVKRPIIDLSACRSEFPRIQNAVVLGEEMGWDRLFSGACGALSGGEVRARTSVIVSRAAVRLGWSVRFPTPPPGDGGCSGAGCLLKKMPHLVLRQIAIEHTAVDAAVKGEKVVQEIRLYDQKISKRLTPLAIPKKNHDEDDDDVNSWAGSGSSGWASMHREMRSFCEKLRKKVVHAVSF
ncbi:Unknown protein [Striga hermonthica]|uniref:Uncharacterized protein n=1 Tax=Striga hermonthica TaxID=68872 RepID=A0A9N7N2C2_STRHE|nr:Unknown protein [Striga hermonthica]